jgi:4-hydroxy-3-methylbut-2-enyl diphosphate reductase IspH
MVREPASERAGIRAERFLMIESHKTPLTILLASPRGFCAGADRAIQIVERAIERYGLPVYVRHEVVHNRTVVVGLEAKRAIFVEELDEVPDDRPVVFSAHGVPKAVPTEAARRKLVFIDATTNRQAAVKAIARHCDALVVIGAANSSNSVHLVEAAAHHGCPKSRLMQRAADMDWNWLTGAGRLGITAGASAPELLVDELVAACRERFDVAVEEVRTTAESVVFRLPRTLMA